MKDTIDNKTVSATLLVTSLVTGVVGAVLFGWVLDKVARIALDLSTDSYTVIIFPSIIIVIFSILGTLCAIMGAFVKQKRTKVAIIIFAFVLPLIIEIVDLSIRGIKIFSEASSTYPFLFG
jgi:hypothetical protein